MEEEPPPTAASMAADERNQHEKEKVTAMRAIVEAKDPRAKEVDDLVLKRFLYARELDVQKASNFFLKHLKWRRSFVPDGLISEDDIRNELPQKKALILGSDKKCHPIGVILGCRHYASKRDVNEFKRYCVYFLDALCDRMPDGQEKFILIVDLQGWGFSNCDVRAYLAALDILQNNYPERLAICFMVYVPYLFMKAWKMIYPFIDDKTKAKFVFLDNKNMKSTLLEHICENQLPEKYGGKLDINAVDDSQL